MVTVNITTRVQGSFYYSYERWGSKRHSAHTPSLTLALKGIIVTVGRPRDGTP